MAARNGIHASAPSVEAVLESLAHVIGKLDPVVSRDIMSHLWGVRRYVVKQYEAHYLDGAIDG